MIQFKYISIIPRRELILSRKIILSVILIVSMGLPLTDIVLPAENLSLSERAGELIKAQVEENNRGSGITLAGEPVYTSKMLARFYTRRNFSPAWSGNRAPSHPRPTARPTGYPRLSATGAAQPQEANEHGSNAA